MITGTPYAVAQEDLRVTVLFVEGEWSTTIAFECGGLQEASECVAMWNSLIHTAIHDPANDENADGLGLDDEVEV